MEIAAAAVAFGQATSAIDTFAKFAKSIGDIPDDFRDFLKELQAITGVSEQVDGLIQGQLIDHEPSFIRLKDDLEDIVKRLHQLLEDVKRPAQKRKSTSNEAQIKVSTIRWERKKTEIAKLRESMRRTRDNLSMYLQLLNLKQGRQVQVDTKKVQHMLETISLRDELFMQETIQRISGVQISVEGTSLGISHIQGAVTQLATTNQSDSPMPTATELALSPAFSHVDPGFDIHGPCPLPNSFSPHCDPYCICHCHEATSSRPLYWLESLLGTLSVDSNTFLFSWRQPCDPRCKYRSYSALIHYTSPGWSTRRDVQISMSWGCLGGPGASLHLRVPRVVDDRIFDVIDSGDVELLKKSLSSGGLSPADVNESGSSVVTFALIFSAVAEVVSLLLETRFDTGICDPDGKSGISAARSRLRIFEHATNEDKTIWRQIGYGEAAVSALPVRLNKVHRALFARDDKRLATVLEDCLQKDIEAWDECGYAPIHYAVETNRFDALALLLKAGANPDLSSRDGPPLVLAANQFRDPEMMRLLLEHGADPNEMNYLGQTAILQTVGQPVKMRMLLDADADVIVGNSTPLNWSNGTYDWTHFGSEVQVEETVHMLLKAGLDINHAGADGATPLMMAIRRCDYVTVRVLLRLGARTDLVDEVGWNILHYAATCRDAKVIDALRSPAVDLSQVDPHQPDKWGGCPSDIEPRPARLGTEILSEDDFFEFCCSIRPPPWEGSDEAPSSERTTSEEESEAQDDSDAHDDADEFFDATS